MTLCPRVAARLGWRPDKRHLFTFLDEHGQVVAQTLYWRDGGVLSHDQDIGIFRRGYLLVVRQDRANDVRPYLTPNQASVAWRATEKGGNREVRYHRRCEAIPS